MVVPQEPTQTFGCDDFAVARGGITIDQLVAEPLGRTLDMGELNVLAKHSLEVVLAEQDDV